MNRLIDRALAEPDWDRRAALWGQVDRRIMRDAPLVPLIWERYSFYWASRVHGWVDDPWTAGPDLTAVWLDPRASDDAIGPERPSRRGDRSRRIRDACS